MYLMSVVFVLMLLSVAHSHRPFNFHHHHLNSVSHTHAHPFFHTHHTHSHHHQSPVFPVVLPSPPVPVYDDVYTIVADGYAEVKLGTYEEFGLAARHAGFNIHEAMRQCHMAKAFFKSSYGFDLSGVPDAVCLGHTKNFYKDGQLFSNYVMPHESTKLRLYLHSGKNRIPRVYTNAPIHRFGWVLKFGLDMPSTNPRVPIVQAGCTLFYGFDSIRPGVDLHHHFVGNEHILNQRNTVNCENALSASPAGDAVVLEHEWHPVGQSITCMERGIAFIDLKNKDKEGRPAFECRTVTVCPANPASP